MAIDFDKEMLNKLVPIAEDMLKIRDRIEAVTQITESCLSLLKPLENEASRIFSAIMLIDNKENKR